LNIFRDFGEGFWLVNSPFGTSQQVLRFPQQLADNNKFIEQQREIMEIGGRIKPRSCTWISSIRRPLRNSCSATLKWFN
jgi:hypothetical protein